MRVNELKEIKGSRLINGFVVEQPCTIEKANETKAMVYLHGDALNLTRSQLQEMIDNAFEMARYGWSPVTCKISLEQAKLFFKPGYRILPAQFLVNDEGFTNLAYVVTGEEVI